MWDYLLSRDDTFYGLAETHIGPADVGKWTAKARHQNLRLFANAARPSKLTTPEGRLDSHESDAAGHSNEGG